MKNIVLLILFGIQSLGFLLAQETEYISLFKNFEKNQIVYLFGDNVHLRASDNADSESLALMPIASMLTILKDYSGKYDDNHPFWMYVKYKNLSGYVRSDFIATQKYKLNQSNLLPIIQEKENYTYHVRIREVDAQGNYLEHPYEIITPQLSIEIFGNKGVKGVDNIIHINYLSEACGVDGGGKYIFIKDQRWTEAFSYSQVVDGGIFYWDETLTFPDEHKKGNFIHYVSKSGATEEDKNYDWSMIEEHTIQRKLYWRNEKIYPLFQKSPLLQDY